MTRAGLAGTACGNGQIALPVLQRARGLRPGDLTKSVVQFDGIGHDGRPTDAADPTRATDDRS
jgi:hypothetical protein